MLSFVISFGILRCALMRMSSVDMDRVPKGMRPLLIEYTVIGRILTSEKQYYNMSRAEFIHLCMFHSNGYMNPNRSSEIYTNLMIDCGLYEVEG